MKLQSFTINDWIYPDTPLTAPGQCASLRTARNNYACLQVLSDLTVAEGTPCTWQADAPEWMEVSVEQMCPVYVAMNSDPKLFTTTDYECCRDYVVRKAPYTVYERIRPMEDGCLEGGRAAFFVRLNVPADAPVGVFTATVSICVNGEQADVPVELTVHKTTALPVSQSPFHMSNTIYQRHMLQFHKAELNSPEYFDWYRKYMRLQVGMRCTLYGLNTAIPIRDEGGKVIGFDFSEIECMAKIALEEGFRELRGGYVARWVNWDAAHNFLNWDKEVSTDSAEGFRQLKLYFKGVREMILRNGWQDCYTQALVDEPQFPNSMSYRALCSTFRKEVPGILIVDPIEASDLYGGCDVSVVKQAIWEQYKEQFQVLADMGEEFRVYACSYPAGKWMNRIIDLPMNATRLFSWMAVRYGMTGISHWGFSAIDPDFMHSLWDACRPRVHKGAPRLFPAGAHSLLYIDSEHLYTSLRYHMTRQSAVDAELLMRLKKLDQETCNAIIDSVCTTFEEYSFDPSDTIRAEQTLLETLDRLA